MNFTDERKVEKFNEVLAEYQRLTVYRHNLMSLITDGIEQVDEKVEGDNPGSYINNTTIKRLDPDKTRKIQQEIARIDAVTNFISSIIYEDGKTIQSDNQSDSQDKEEINENTH